MTRSPLQLAILSCLIGEYPEPVEYMRLLYGLMACRFLPADMASAILSLSQATVALEERGLLSLISASPECVCALTNAAVEEMKKQLAERGGTFEQMQADLREAAAMNQKAVTIQ